MQISVSKNMQKTLIWGEAHLNQPLVPPSVEFILDSERGLTMMRMVKEFPVN